MKKILIALWLMGAASSAGEIKIAVAANVSYAMDTLIEAFAKQYPDTDVQVTLGSSGKLTAQIKNGAPYQLFMAANMKYPGALYAEKIAVTEPVVYAQGSLAYLSLKGLDLSKGIGVVTSPSVKKIALTNPKTAPYGKAALEALEKGGVYAQAKPKLVYAETVTQTVTYTMTAVDLGFIAKSSLYSPKMTHYREGIEWVEVDPSLYTPIDQGIVILKNGQGHPGVEAFYRFILGPEAQAILHAYGYLTPDLSAAKPASSR
jgi:molybdate transport system substrate-binding protein